MKKQQRTAKVQPAETKSNVESKIVSLSESSEPNPPELLIGKDVQRNKVVSLSEVGQASETNVAELEDQTEIVDQTYNEIEGVVDAHEKEQKDVEPIFD